MSYSSCASTHLLVLPISALFFHHFHRKLPPPPTRPAAPPPASNKHLWYHLEHRPQREQQCELRRSEDLRVSTSNDLKNYSGTCSIPRTQRNKSACHMSYCAFLTLRLAARNDRRTLLHVAFQTFPEKQTTQRIIIQNMQLPGSSASEGGGLTTGQKPPQGASVARPPWPRLY